jgi:hypothetical protein
MISSHVISEQPLSTARALLIFGFGRATARARSEFRLYAATHEFATLPSDPLLPNVPFPGTVQRALRLERTIIDGQRFGRLAQTWGELELLNASGEYDDYIDRYSIDGRRIVIKAGQLDAFGVATTPYSRFVPIFDGTAADWHVDDEAVRITLRDDSFRLEVPAAPETYAGGGALNGGDDLKGKRVPWALGEVRNVSPPLLIPAELVYQLSRGAISSVDAVYDRGIELLADTQYSTVAQLRAATLPPGSYATTTTGVMEGSYLRLGASPDGTVTVDMKGDASGSGYVNTTGAIVRRIVDTATDVVDPDDLDVASFINLDADQPGVVGYWIGPDNEETVREAVDKLLNGIGAWGAFDRSGMFEVGQMLAPAGVPHGRYSQVEILSVRRERLPSGLTPPPYRFRVAWGQNWTVQTDLGDPVPAADIAFAREEFRTAISSDAALSTRVQQAHPLAQDPEPVLAYFASEADAIAEADRLMELYSRETRSLYSIKVKLQGFLHEIGDTIVVTYPRWDLHDGRQLRIVGFSEDTDERSVELKAFG